MVSSKTPVSKVTANRDLDDEAREWWPFRDDPAVLHWLATHYMGFARRVAMVVYQQNRHRSLELEEIENAAFEGLMEAIHRFKPETSSAAFTSFAFLRIRGACIGVARSRDWVPHSARAAEKNGISSIPLMLRMDEQRDSRIPDHESDSRVDLESLIPELPKHHLRILAGLLHDNPEVVAKREYSNPAAVLSIAGRYL